ncbi:MAG: acetolactate synthase small subunit [Desulfobacterales bacterium]|nr:acetolactate synthase small subunit [Desulfobacterales bacterium]MDD4072128.1 acetolactate synthase small subunit [Desulfobacterales bacterium]MDD4391265.1 acetolactate synthase small subunit [Desulfobacterales bacterium]
MLKIISILVHNHPGVLSHVAGLFTRRAYNIASIAAGETENPEVTRITITVAGDEMVLDQVTKQLEKLVDVIKVRDLSYSESITRELALLTIFVAREKRLEVITIANTLGAVVSDMSDATMTLEFVGNRRKIDTIIHALEGFNIKELARTGIVALPLESQLEKNRHLL